MDFQRRKFLQKSLAAAGAGMLSPLNSMGTMNDTSEFTAQQRQQREKLFSLLGDLPSDYSPNPPKLIRKEKQDGYTLEYIDFDFNGIDRVPGILLVPDKIKEKAPCMLYCHAHFGTYDIGKDELINGRPVMPAYAPVYAQKGILTLAIDSWCFGERKAHGEMDTFKKDPSII
jgi:hypothetical protein